MRINFRARHNDYLKTKNTMKTKNTSYFLLNYLFSNLF